MKQRLAQQASASAAQRVERSREVAAVDRRDGNRPDWFKITGVVPVENMSAKLLQLVVGFQTLPGEESELRNREISKRYRRLPGIQQQSKVGWRNARGFEQPLFLDVIGNEVIVALPTELVKEAPGAQGELPQ